MSGSPVVVAIDGPAASGKSSVARRVARELGFLYLNTGAMYRGATWHVLRAGVDLADAGAVAAAVAGAGVRLEVEGGEARMRIGGQMPTDEQLSAPEVNAGVSIVARIRAVREILVARQREFGAAADAVIEGRDIGSVVFPDTPHKFYIDASPEVRARRRAAQGLEDSVAARDRVDSSRAASPLTVPADAEVIDTSELALEQVVGKVLERLSRRGLGRAIPG